MLSYPIRVEGRSWYTSHRGKLWIAAAAKVPESKVITDVTQFYTAYYGTYWSCDSHMTFM